MLSGDDLRQSEVAFHDIAHRPDAIHNPGHPRTCKTHPKENAFEEEPLDTIVGFAHLKLSHKTFVQHILRALEVIMSSCAIKKLSCIIRPRMKVL